MTEFDSVIPAGGSGKLTAKIRTTSTQNGAVSKSIAVNTDAPGAERLLLSLTFKAVAGIAVLPRPQLTLMGTEGDRPSATLIVRRNDDKPLEITNVDNRDPRIVVTTEPVTEARVVNRQQAKAGDVLLTVTTAENDGPVTVNGKFKIATNHPDTPSVDVAYAIRLRPLIEPRPQQVRLILQDGNATGRTTLFRMQHNRRGEFKITGVRVSKPELIKVELVDGDVKEQVHTVAVMLQDKVQPGDLDSRQIGQIVFTTDDPHQSEVEVSVLVEPRDLRRPADRKPAS